VAFVLSDLTFALSHNYFLGAKMTRQQFEEKKYKGKAVSEKEE
jgi:hypothetical protein